MTAVVQGVCKWYKVPKDFPPAFPRGAWTKVAVANKYSDRWRTHFVGTEFGINGAATYLPAGDTKFHDDPPPIEPGDRVVIRQPTLGEECKCRIGLHGAQFMYLHRKLTEQFTEGVAAITPYPGGCGLRVKFGNGTPLSVPKQLIVSVYKKEEIEEKEETMNADNATQESSTTPTDLLPGVGDYVVGVIPGKDWRCPLGRGIDYYGDYYGDFVPGKSFRGEVTEVDDIDNSFKLDQAGGWYHVSWVTAGNTAVEQETRELRENNAFLRTEVNRLENQLREQQGSAVQERQKLIDERQSALDWAHAAEELAESAEECSKEHTRLSETLKKRNRFLEGEIIRLQREKVELEEKADFLSVALKTLTDRMEGRNRPLPQPQRSQSLVIPIVLMVVSLAAAGYLGYFHLDSIIYYLGIFLP